MFGIVWINRFRNLLKDNGYLRWFTEELFNLLRAHKYLYGDIIEKYFKGELIPWEA